MNAYFPVSPPTSDMISTFLIFANLTSERWHLADVLVYVPLTIRDVEYLFSTYGSLLLLLFFWDFAPTSYLPFFLLICVNTSPIMTLTIILFCVQQIFSSDLWLAF